MWKVRGLALEGGLQILFSSVLLLPTMGAFCRHLAFEFAFSHAVKPEPVTLLSKTYEYVTAHHICKLINKDVTTEVTAAIDTVQNMSQGEGRTIELKGPPNALLVLLLCSFFIC